MNLDLCLYVGGNDWDGEHACKVLGQSSWVHSLDDTTRGFCKLAQRVDVTLITFDRDNIYGYTGCLSDLSNNFVEGVSFLHIFLGHALVKGTQSDICETIRANDHSGPFAAFSRHADRCNDGWSESCWSCLFDGSQLFKQNFVCLGNRLLESLFALGLTIGLQELDVVKLVSCDCLGIFGAVAYDSDLVIESHYSYFALSSSLGHVLDLIFDCGFNALDTRYIGLVLLGVAQELVRPIAKLLQILVELRDVVSFDLVLSLDCLGDAHGTRDVKAEDDRDVLARHLFLLHLSWCLNKIRDFVGFWNFLIINHDFVLLVTELTLPDLLSSLSGQVAQLAEHSFAYLAELGVPCCYLFL